MDDHPRPSWPLPDGEGLRDALLAAYSDSARSYHDISHLAAVLRRLQELAAAGTPFDPLPVLLAAWFHDAEERSAAWAEEALPTLTDPAIVTEVARLVRLTEHHRPSDDDVNGCALSDADLGVLATPPDEYDAYVAAVRTEYSHLEDDVFAAGRANVLRTLDDKPELFHTDYAQEHWEAPARENLARELSTLVAAAAS